MKSITLLFFAMLASSLPTAAKPETSILIEFGIANMEAVECESCWPNGIITRFGQSATIQKKESGKLIHIRVLPEQTSSGTTLTITPLETNESGETEELDSVLLRFSGMETQIMEHNGFDLTFSVKPYKRK